MHKLTQQIFSFLFLWSRSDIDLYTKDNQVAVKVNGREIPLENLPYQHPSGSYMHSLHKQTLNVN